MHIWVSRPVPGKVGCSQTLPVDWTAITQAGITKTNYQLLPGYQVFIEQDETEVKFERAEIPCGSGSTLRDYDTRRVHPQVNPSF